MTDPTSVVFTVKELLTRLDERIGDIDRKLDLRLNLLDERVHKVEETQTARQHLVAEHEQMRRDVAELKAFRARFLPISLVVALIAGIALAADLVIRIT